MPKDIEEGFIEVLADFKKRLKPEEQADFALTELSDLQEAIFHLQEKQKKTKTARNLRRIQPFLQAMGQFKEIIEVFLNTSDILCFVWGPMKFMLLTASNMSESFEILLDTYRQISENFPLLLQYRSLFSTSSSIGKILVWIFEDILKFHLRALRIFSQPAWKKLFKSTWTNFQASFKPLLENLVRHRELIERSANLEEIENWRDARLQSEASFTALEAKKIVERKLAVLAWLSAADAQTDQDNFTGIREDIRGTGQWILKESQMQDWLDRDNTQTPMLWINGKPGAGKTILASVIIEECSKRFELKKADSSWAFFYCRDSDNERNTATSVAKGILAQLLCQNLSVLPYLYGRLNASITPTLSSWNNCKECLTTILEAVPLTFLVIDGIDECELKERKLILNLFTSVASSHSITATGKTRCLFVSQKLDDIKKSLGDCETIELRASHNEDDVRNYAEKWSVKIQKKFEAMPEDARKRIVELVCNGEDGMFLFARLVLENLYYQENLVNLYGELRSDTFPAGFDQAYGRIVERIFQNPNETQQKTARKILGWITFSKRPLKWHEIQGAASIDTEHRQVNFEGRKLYDHIREICGSLVEVLPGDRVQLVHATARQYLVHKECLNASQEETRLASLCLGYLTFEGFEPSMDREKVSENVRTGYYAFLDYASLHWFHHLEAASKLLKTGDLGSSADLVAAIDEFFAMYEPATSTPDREYAQYLSKNSTIQDAGCYDDILLLLSHAKSRRNSEENLKALGNLGSFLTNVRSILEELRCCDTLDNNMMEKLKDFYGGKWHKCSRHACYYFHEGFTSKKALSQHTDRHEKPFCCTEMGCTRMYIGWSTEKELKRHLSLVHPDPEAFSWKFPHVKRTPTKFPCDLCEKTYNRANSLSTHKLREHTKERKFTCKICVKGFVRKCDLERHETIHKEPLLPDQSTADTVMAG